MQVYGIDLSMGKFDVNFLDAFYRLNMHLKKTDDSGMVSLAAGVFSKLINSWCDLSSREEGLVIAPYKRSISTNIMQPYAHGEVQLSVRYNRKDQFEAVDKKLKSLIPRKKYAEQIQFQIDGGLNRDPMLETGQVKSLYITVKELSQTLDIRITREHRWSSSDICFTEPGVTVLDGFGPIGQKVHGQSEFILRHSLLERALLIAMTLKELSQE